MNLRFGQRSFASQLLTSKATLSPEKFGMFYVVEDGKKLRDDVANAKSSTPLYEIIIITIVIIITVITPTEKKNGSEAPQVPQP